MAISDLSLMLAKTEAVYGTWAAPAPATDASVIFGYTMTPIEGEDVRRQTERGFHGTNPSFRTAKRQRHVFSQELTGAGTADGIAPWAKFTRGCQFGAPVPVAATECGYPLIGVGGWRLAQPRRQQGQRLRSARQGCPRQYDDQPR